MKGEEIYIDVDGTLIDHNNTLFEGVEECLSSLTKWYSLVCWSFGGKDYAREICEMHRLGRYFVRYETKPQFMIDDDFNWITKYPRKLTIRNGDWTEVLQYCGLLKRE